MSQEIAVRNNTPKKPYAERGAWYEKFLVEYAETGHVTASAAAAGVTRDAVYKARERDEEFAAAYERARRYVAQDLEATAIKRAKSHSDTLLIFLLKGLMPEVHGDRVLHGHTGEVNIKLVYD